MNLVHKSLIITVLVIGLIVTPLLIFKDGDFSGTDEAAKEVILKNNPDYVPWFKSVWQPTSGEIESLLFTFQAALGAGFIGYYIGYKKGKKVSDK